jgi:integrase
MLPTRHPLERPAGLVTLLDAWIETETHMSETIAPAPARQKMVELKAITAKLTQKLIGSTAVGAYERVELRDTATPGLSLRISGPSERRADGTKAWSLVYRVAGETAQRRIALGAYPGTDIDRARELAEDHKRVARSGIDPQAKLATEAAAFKAEQTKAANRKTVKAVFEEYLAHGMVGRSATHKADTESKFKRLVYPYIGDRFVDEVTSQDVALLFEKVTEENGPVAANRMLTAVKRAFNWTAASRSNWLKANPVGKIERNDEDSDSRPLVDAELPHIWKAADKLGYPCGDALKLMLLTGQRRGDVSGMRFKDIDFDIGAWKQPKWRDRALGKGGNKARREHYLLLPAAALVILRRLKEQMATHPGRRPGDDHVFVEANSRKPGAPLQNGWHAAQPKLRELASEIAGRDLEHWEVEWARHTVRTNLSRKPISAEEIVSELILNHSVKGKLVKVYNQHDYIDEMGDVLKGWERRLLAIVEPGEGKVIKHPRAAG